MPPQFRRPFFALLLAGLLATAACAGATVTREGPAATPTPPAAQSVEIKLFVYTPQQVEVPVGTSITWINRDAIEHSVTNGSAAAPGGAFDSGLFSEGTSFMRTFEEPGVYPYFCTRHPHMQGEVRVN